jgi:ATP-dependent helicase Lhr and Lhr-like helicase
MAMGEQEPPVTVAAEASVPSAASPRSSQELLHPLLAHHIVNSLGWRSLRPLQQKAIEPILAKQHALVIAPTAGGKTEAAVFPVLSRMLSEDWSGLSVLYLCPLRALLNNLHPRLEGYGRLVGRRAGLWHGDVGKSAREQIRSDPPDLLLTTPESIEAMLISRKTDHAWLFRDLRAVVVDEIHAFAGDDRGWHLLAVVQRLQRLAGRSLQRIGLSATVGNPDGLLEWLTAGVPEEPRRVVQPTDAIGRSDGGRGTSHDAGRGGGHDVAGGSRRDVEVTVDYVGSVANAATVISRLHRGEKRLVFVDSRARVEELALALRDRDVTTFLSHGSLGSEERRAAEQAFAESRDCVIVATSTLELGIDVGDLDRVVQLDAPMTVASFLQRLGRTGRRSGTVANLLFLATSEEAFAQTLGLCLAWEDGFVEPLEAPAYPVHLLGQQFLALLIQEGGLGRYTWSDWLGRPVILGTDVAAVESALVTHLLETGVVAEDNGLVWLGPEGERRFGRRNFLGLMTVFSEAPLLKVRHGRNHLGQIPTRLLLHEEEDGHVILLAGRSWVVRHVDWKRQIAQVEPAEDRGKARWFGSGRGLSFELAQRIRQALADREPIRVDLSRRAVERLERLRERYWWAGGDDTVLVRDVTGQTHWWTFAGLEGNLWLSTALGDRREVKVPRSDLAIRVRSDASAEEVRRMIDGLDVEALTLANEIAEGAVEQLKFGDLLPEQLAREIVERRLRDDEAVGKIGAVPVRTVQLAAGGGRS